MKKQETGNAFFFFFNILMDVLATILKSPGNIISIALPLKQLQSLSSSMYAEFRLNIVNNITLCNF